MFLKINFFFLIASLVIVHQSFAQPERSIEWKQKNVIFGAWSLLDGSSESQGGALIVDAGGESLLASQLWADFRLALSLNSARVQEPFDVYHRRSGIFLRQGFIKYSFSDFIRLDLGVLNPNYYSKSSLMLSPTPSLGAGLNVALSDWRFLVLGTIPPSSSSNLERVEFEERPLYGVLRSSWMREVFEGHNLLLGGGYFIYHDLPSVVAYESGLRGNIVKVIDGTKTGVFWFEFKGWEAELAYCYKPQDLCIEALWAKNQEAPKELSRAHILRFKKGFNSKGVYFDIGRFFLESEVMPALYGFWEYGYTDSKGYYFSIMKELHTDLSLFFRYIEGASSQRAVDKKFRSLELSLSVTLF